MNQIRVNGTLSKGEEKYIPGYVYWLSVRRRSGTVDKLLVMSPDDGLIEGDVQLEGHLEACYIPKCGVPAFIVPDSVKAGEADGFCETEVSGILKDNARCRNTPGGKTVASVVLRTEKGQIPVLLWGLDAEDAEKSLKAGDVVTAVGRMQSRSYRDRKGKKQFTYELSSRSKLKKEGAL